MVFASLRAARKVHDVAVRAVVFPHVAPEAWLSCERPSFVLVGPSARPRPRAATSEALRIELEQTRGGAANAATTPPAPQLVPAKRD